MRTVNFHLEVAMSRETDEILVTVNIDEGRMSITPVDALEASNMIRVAAERAIMLQHLKKFLCDNASGMELENEEAGVFLTGLTSYIEGKESGTGTRTE